MLFFKIIFVALIIYLLWYFLVPKGTFLYEGIRLLEWYWRLMAFPSGDFETQKIHYGPHRRQYLLFYKPKVDGNKRHVILYFHGGGWQFGKPEAFRPNAKVLLERGYYVFMPSHRRVPMHNITHMRHDVAAITARVLEIMGQEGLSAKKIIMGGISSGGNLAALKIFDFTLLQQSGIDRSRFAAVFFLGAPLNLHGMWHSPPLLFLVGKRSGEKFRLANPYDHLQPNEKLPIFIMHGTKDGLVEYRSVLAFYEKLKALGAEDVRLETLHDGVHLDPASWCYEWHPAHRLMLDWLEQIERR
ncbi:MAG: alpha/beta hydrolase [Lewinellaceae bacterium]|nr:alpha/beta hydrolase [Saprospiraceae bacterium]MCB9339273.1 alpha/beta hydrolase [Lewinellaceae bacterium]